MDIYTKTGDGGETSLYGGTRVSKDDLRVWCYGVADEACAILGVVYAAAAIPRIKDIVRTIQRRFFTLNAELASDDKGRDKLKDHITAEDTAFLENIIDEYTRDFGSLSGFTIPGETVCSSLLHVARTVVRRCERHIISLAGADHVSPEILIYINRLSDALFVLAKMEVIEMFIKQVAGKVAVAMGEGVPDGWTGDICEKLCQAALAESEKMGVPICFAIADRNGSLVFFYRQPGALLVSVSIAQNKAYTSAVLRMPTGDLASLAGPGGSLFGINTADPKLVVFGGGFPMYKNGNLIGAIGVSGGSVEEDEQIARAALEVLEKS